MLAVFVEFERDILRGRVKADIAQARLDGKPHCRPHSPQMISTMRRLSKQGLSKRAIAKAAFGQPHFSHSIAAFPETSLA
jgi:DNA invertase Pin-like site-specific DNA recombinase